MAVLEKYREMEVLSEPALSPVIPRLASLAAFYSLIPMGLGRPITFYGRRTKQALHFGRRHAHLQPLDIIAELSIGTCRGTTNEHYTDTRPGYPTNDSVS